MTKFIKCAVVLFMTQDGTNRKVKNNSTEINFGRSRKYVRNY